MLFLAAPITVTTCLLKMPIVLLSHHPFNGRIKLMLHLHNDRSHAWLDPGVRSGIRHMRLGGPQDQERGLDLSPHAGALLLGAPCALSPPANSSLCWFVMTGQDSRPLGPGRQWQVDPVGPEEAGSGWLLTRPGSASLPGVRSRGRR